MRYSTRVPGSARVFVAVPAIEESAEIVAPISVRPVDPVVFFGECESLGIRARNEVDLLEAGDYFGSWSSVVGIVAPIDCLEKLFRVEGTTVDLPGALG